MRRAISLVFLCHGLVAGSWSTRIPWIQEHLGLSATTLGLVLLATAGGSVAGLLAAGPLLARFGARDATAILVPIYCLTLGLPALSPSVPVLCLALVLYGAAAGTSNVAVNAEASGVEKAAGQPIMTRLHGMWSVGMLLGAGLGALAASFSVAAPPHLGAVAVLAAGGAWWAARSLPVRPGAPAPERRLALPSRSVVVIGLVAFCSSFAESSVVNWSGVYVRDVTGADAVAAALAYVAFACTSAFSRLGSVAVIVRLGIVKTVRAGALTGLAGGLLAVFAPATWVAALGFALIGLGLATVVPQSFSAAADAAPTPGEGVSGIAMMTLFAGLGGPTLFGVVADAFSPRASFLLVTAAVAAIALAAPVLRPRVSAPVPVPA
uniref:MFS transporter n=1 Tax=Herbidospora sakaeratensis TaxID=564415 RepID=UPI00078676AD|nr:MFS transporter [Herbidospora sakaeratensis]